MSDLQFQKLESLWRSYLMRRKATPDLTIHTFADENPDSKDDIIKLFPMMEGLSEYAKDPLGSPTRIDDYEIVRQIGIGGMGIVYEATSEALHEKVAIKVVESSMLGGDNERLAREARLAATLHHSHIVPVYEFGEFEEKHYYTMKLVEGPNLAEVLYCNSSEFEELAATERRALEAADKLAENWPLQIDLIRDAASAIEYAHSKNILHRDVKPANLLLDEDLHVWVTDFGLAKYRSPLGDQLTTARNKLMGTPRYMAPEQIRGVTDERSDVFGLGLTFYELCLLTKSGDNNRKPIWEGGLRPPRELNPNVPAALELIIMKAVSLDPDERYGSMSAFIAALDRFENRPSRGAAAAANTVNTTSPSQDSDHSNLGASESTDSAAIDLMDESYGSSSKSWWLATAAIALVLLIPALLRFSKGSKKPEPGTPNPTVVASNDNANRESSTVQPIKEPLPPRPAANSTNSNSIASGAPDSNAASPPSFAANMFAGDGRTIELPASKIKTPVVLELEDEEYSAFDGLDVAITGGADRDRLVMTPQGILAFAFPVAHDEPQDENRDNQYEIDVLVSNDTRICFLRCESEDGRLRLVKDTLVSGAPPRIRSTVIAENVALPHNLIDIATADGKTIYHLHQNEDGSTALYESQLNTSGLTATKLLVAQPEIDGDPVGFATLDGSEFMVACGGLANQLAVVQMRLEGDALHAGKRIERSRLSKTLSGLGWLDERRFQLVRPDANGEGEFCFSFLVDQQFVNMPLAKSSQFKTETVGSATWLERGDASQSTSRAIRLKIVESR